MKMVKIKTTCIRKIGYCLGPSKTKSKSQATMTPLYRDTVAIENHVTKSDTEKFLRNIQIS